MPKFKNSAEYEKWKAEKLTKPAKQEEQKKSPTPDLETGKLMKKALAAGILIISISISYYFLLYKPMKSSQEISEVKEQKALALHEDEIREEKRIQEERIRQLNEETKRKYLERDAEWVKEEVTKTQLETERSKQEELKLSAEAERYKQEEMKRNLKEKELLDECIENAWESYQERWNATCRNNDLDDSCSLSSDISEAYASDRQRNIDNCYKSYDRFSN